MIEPMMRLYLDILGRSDDHLEAAKAQALAPRIGTITFVYFKPRLKESAPAAVRRMLRMMRALADAEAKRPRLGRPPRTSRSRSR